MPDRALRFCTHPGCPARVPKGRCPAHAREHERARGSAASRGYDAEWRALRAAHLAEHPLCVVCGAQATDVDHVESVREAPHRRLDPANLRSFCHSHHSQRTRRDHCATTTRTSPRPITHDWSSLG